MRTIIAEMMHPVPIIYPQGSAAPTMSSDIVSLKNASHVSILLAVGAQAGAFTAKLYEGSDFSDCTTELAGAVYKEETTNSDQLGDRTAVVAASGVTIAATNNIFYVFEVDVEDLTEGNTNIQLKLSGLDNATYVCAWAILSGYAFQGKEHVTEIA